MYSPASRVPPSSWFTLQTSLECVSTLPGYTEQWGHELFKIDDELTVQALSYEDVIETNVSEEDEIITAFPNPFTTEIILRVNNINNGDDAFALRVVTVDGRIIDSNPMLGCDTDHHLGNTWPGGLYIIQIIKDNQHVTKRIVKR